MSDERANRLKVRDSDMQQQKSSAGHAAEQKKRHAHPGGPAGADFVRKDVYNQQPQRPINQQPYPEPYHIWQPAHPPQQALVKPEMPVTCVMQNPLSTRQQPHQSPWNFQSHPQYQLQPELQYQSQPRVKIEPQAEPRYPLQPGHLHHSQQLPISHHYQLTESPVQDVWALPTLEESSHLIFSSPAPISPLCRQGSLTPSDSIESRERSRSPSRSPKSPVLNLTRPKNYSSSMSAGGCRSSQATSRRRPRAKHYFQSSEETFLAEQLVEPEIEEVLNGPSDSVNDFYRSRADVHRELARRFWDQFDVSLTGLQIKNKIATMRRQYAKAAACKREMDEGRARNRALVKRRIRTLCPFFDTVDDVWCKSWLFIERPAVDSTADVGNADEACDIDEEWANYQRIRRYEIERQRKEMERERKEMEREREEIERKRKETMREHQETLKRIQADARAQVESIKSERIKLERMRARDDLRRAETMAKLVALLEKN